MTLETTLNRATGYFEQTIKLWNTKQQQEKKKLPEKEKL